MAKRVTTASLARNLRACLAAGIPVSRILPDGTIDVAGEDAPSPAEHKPKSGLPSADDIMARMAQ